MPGGLSEYSGLVTKTKAMHGRLLKPEDYVRISEYETVEEFITFLRESEGYGEVFFNREGIAHRGQVETIIGDALYMDYRKLYRFAGVKPREALDIIFFRYETNFLQDCLQRAVNGGEREPKRPGPFFEAHACYDAAAAIAAGSIQELAAAVEGTRFAALLGNFSSEAAGYADKAFALDVYYYKNAWRMTGKLRDKTLRRIMREILGTKIDWLNIMWMYRFKRFYSVSREELAAHVIPVRWRLTAAEIQALLEAPGVDEYTDLVGRTVYLKGKDGAAGLGEELTWQKIVQRSYEQVCKKYPMSIAPVLKYLSEREREIDRLTTALEGIRYRLPAKEIRELILTA